MAKYSEPKDYMLGRKAYKAYFDGVGIEFTDLSHDYQMRWVNVARAVINETKRLTRNAPKLALTDDQLLNSAPRLPCGRINYKAIDAKDVEQVRAASIRLSKKRYQDAAKKRNSETKE